MGDRVVMCNESEAIFEETRAMNDEDDYDVRAVEARLARMEAARRARVVTSKPQAPTQHTPAIVGGVAHVKVQETGVRPTVGDFELSAVDSESDSDECGSASTSSASDDEGHLQLKSRGSTEGKRRLKDSLDLSMSMPVAWEPEVARTCKTGSAKRETKQETKQREDSKFMGTSHVVTTVQSGNASRTVDDDREDLFAGKLIQRRRELERNAMHEAGRATQNLQHEEHSVRLTRVRDSALSSSDGQRATRSDQETVKLLVEKPKPTASRLPKPMELHKDETQQAHHHGTERRTTPPVARIPKTQEPCEPDRAVVSRTQAAPVPAKVTQPKPDDTTVRCEPPIVEAIRPLASAAANKLFLTAAPPVSASAIAQRGPNLATKEPVPGDPRTIAPVKKTVAFAAIQPTSALAQAPTVTTTIATTTTTATARQAYARGGNQPHALAPTLQPSIPAVVASKKEPQEDPEDLIDDLLTAEELRLRESLDKLSSRLNSLTMVRENMTRTTKSSTASDSGSQYAGRKSLQPSGSVGDDVFVDDAKTIRAGSYGGGAHAKLHQPSSPTTRASNAKRSELSSGVHKARVRPGGTLVQDTGGVSVAEGGKHKVVIKKDLAHLLF